MRFFLYGTLMAGAENPVARALHAVLLPGSPASVAGHLYALPDPGGWYPALLPGAGVVHGMLHAAGPDFTPADLAAIDAWEGFDPAAPDAGDYVRQRLPVRAAEGVVAAEVFCWAGALPAGAQPIADGDFARWLAETGHRGFAG